MNKFMNFLLVLLSVMLISCGSQDNDKIVIWTHASPDHPEGKMFQARVDSYNEAHPDKLPVELVNITRGGAGSGYIDKLNAALTAGTLPDIFTLDGPDVAAYVDAEVIGELDSYLSDGFKEGFTEGIQKQGTVNDKFYGLGYSDSAVVIMYNEDMINALPQEVKDILPDVDETWSVDDLTKLAIKIDEFAKITDDPAFTDYKLALSTLMANVGSEYELGTYFYLPLIWSNGGQIVGNDGVTIRGYMDSPEVKDALLEYSKLFTNGDGVASIVEPKNSFQTGKAALAFSGHWGINELIENYPSLNFKTVRYPLMSKNYDGLYTPSGSWAFVRKAEVEEEKLEQVVEVMEWLTNDEAAKEYFITAGAIPTRKNSLDVIKTDTDNKKYNEAWDVVKYQVANTNKARPSSPGYPFLSEVFAKDVLLKIAQNKASTEEEIEAYIDEAIKRLEFEFKKFEK